MSESKEFYVGYHPRMPAALAPFVRLVVVILLLAVASLGVVIPALHKDYAAARSEYPVIRDFEGILVAGPVAHLLVARPGHEPGERLFSRYVLVGQGKSAPQIDVEALAGKTVRARGWLIFRGAQTLIAVGSAEEIAPASSGAAALALSRLGAGTFRASSLGTKTLRGEIVDSKCYLGTMRPGSSKVHRACAVRCIAGGVPPMFVTRDHAGNRMAFLLIDADGSSVNQRVLGLVAEPLEVTGQVTRMGDTFVLKADPDSYERLRDSRRTKG